MPLTVPPTLKVLVTQLMLTVVMLPLTIDPLPFVTVQVWLGERGWLATVTA